MSNEYKDRERGQAAEQILKHPLWEEAWGNYRQRLFEELERHAGSANQAVKDLLLARLSVSVAVRNEIEAILKNGKLAEKIIEDEEQRKSLGDRVRTLWR